MAGKEDSRRGDKRRALMSRIATGDWDGVLITHASFERLEDERTEFWRNASRTKSISSRMQFAPRSRIARQPIVKELARAKKAWEAKLAKLSGKAKKDDL